MRRFIGVSALALAVVSCGGGGGGGDDGSSGGTNAPPAGSDSGSYETVREMQLDVERAFILCTAPIKVYDPPVVEGAVAQADCKSDLGLLIFEPGDVQTGAAALQGETDFLFGDNWIITCSSEKGDCEKIQGITGGELITGS